MDKYELNFDELASDCHYAIKEYDERAIGYSKYPILSKYLGSHYHSSFIEFYTQLEQYRVAETVCSKQNYDKLKEQAQQAHLRIISYKTKLASQTEQVIHIKVEQISDWLNLPHSNVELSVQIDIITQKLASQSIIYRSELPVNPENPKHKSK